ncbi:sigma-70 family RNA polymerase sigma factor [Qaidamihabitans albus]|uniref:sigma-70 family RNA polymerase sigma factor n=1 Tax=Qaidamihabitans albus TaxID=2795733 RepID=UPI0018F13DF2|nr:sigma-70 family RNA polymerase sigma factor [Qaidamihabitans albus]
MSTVPADLSGKSDAELIASVRAGKIAAYGTLYERHSTAAHNLARQLTRSPAEADDLVSEAFAKVLDTLRAGKGPDSAFRAYLLTALRHTAYDKTRKDKRLDLNEDMTAVGGPAAEALTVPFSDTAVAGLERTMAAKAFARLPERWQAVLWHTEIEQQSPAEVAPILGLTANGVSALAYRAREGLRQAYLQVHLAETSAERCRATADRLGAWTRDGLSKRERAQVETHLDECDRCRALAAELADVNGALRAIVAPLVLGGAVLGYLAAAGATKASAATAGAAAVGAGAAAGSSGGAAAGAAAGGPRQFVGLAASGVAMAAAVAVALTAGGGQQIPAAQQPPPPATEAPAAPEPPPQQPAQPPPAPAPEQPDVPPAPLPEPGPAPAVPPPPPAPEPPPPAPEPAADPPKVTAQAPAETIELDPGSGSPVDVPITVRNDGGTASDPVVVTLALPEGVRAEGPPSGGGGAPLAAAGQAPRQSGQVAETVACPGGTGTVRCSTREGLEPGESAVLRFRLVADENAEPGQVTGTIDSGSPVEVSINIPVTVRQPDAVTVQAATAFHPWSRVVHVAVRNTGPRPGDTTVSADKAAHAIIGGAAVDCGPAGQLPCTSREQLEPGEDLHLWISLRPTPAPKTEVVVTATLGNATDSAAVSFDCQGPWWCHWPDHPGGRHPAPETTEPSVPVTPEVTTTTPAESPTTSTEAPSGPPTTAPTTTPTTEPAEPEEPIERPEPPAPPAPPAPPSEPPGQPGKPKRGLWDWVPWLG